MAHRTCARRKRVAGSWPLPSRSGWPARASTCTASRGSRSWSTGCWRTRANRPDQTAAADGRGSAAGPPPVGGWLALGAVAFVAADPYLRPDPVGRLAGSIAYHGGYATSAAVQDTGWPFVAAARVADGLRAVRTTLARSSVTAGSRHHRRSRSSGLLTAVARAADVRAVARRSGSPSSSSGRRSGRSTCSSCRRRCPRRRAWAPESRSSRRAPGSSGLRSRVDRRPPRRAASAAASATSATRRRGSSPASSASRCWR